MKRYAILFIALLCAIAACKKPSGPANGKSVQQDNNRDSLVSIYATINGDGWQTDSVFAYIVKSSGNDSNLYNLMITAVNKKTSVPSTMNFVIYNYNGLARYTINPPFVSINYYLGTLRHVATYGNINLTSNANFSLIGDFFFTSDSLTVNGSFNVANP